MLIFRLGITYSKPFFVVILCWFVVGNLSAEKPRCEPDPISTANAWKLKLFVTYRFVSIAFETPQTFHERYVWEGHINICRVCAIWIKFILPWSKINLWKKIFHAKRKVFNFFLNSKRAKLKLPQHTSRLPEAGNQYMHFYTPNTKFVTQRRKCRTPYTIYNKAWRS